MSEKISQYSTSVSALATGDLMDVSKLISTSPDVYQSQKLNYSLLISELNNDLSFVDGTGTANYSARFSASGTVANGILQDNATTIGIGSLDAAVSFNLNTSLQVGQRVTQSKTNGNSEGIEGINYAANSGRNVGIAGYGGNASTESIGVRGVYKTTSASNDNTSSYIANGDGAGGFFQAARTGAGTIYGIIATTNLLTPDAAVTGVAGYFKAAGGGSNYAIQLVDGTEGAGKYLQSDASGRASWVALSVSNLGSSNLTSADNARTFTLKAGGTSSQYLSIESTPGTSLLKLYGDKTVLIGDENRPSIKFDTYGVTSFAILQYCASGSTYAYNVYDSGNNERFRVESSGLVYAKRGSIGTTLNYTSSINLWADGTSSSFHFVGTNGSNQTLYLGNDSGHGYAEIKNSSGVTKSRISGNGDSYFLNNLAVGVSSASALLHIKGPGSTSATTTALFQNSSSATVAQFKDDLTSTFGGVVTAPQIITTPATVTVAANAGTVTRANRTNNFTNSSAAAMTITISLTGALDGDIVMVRIFDFSAVAQTITWVNTENSSVTVPATSNGSTTLPLTVGFQYNGATSKWRCVGSV